MVWVSVMCEGTGNAYRTYGKRDRKLYITILNDSLHASLDYYSKEYEPTRTVTPNALVRRSKVGLANTEV